MRLLLDTLIALTVTAILGGVVMTKQVHQQDLGRRELVRADLRRIEAQVSLQAALHTVPLSPRGFPLTIRKVWFGDRLPANRLLGPGHPWMDVATAAEAELEHPLNPAATRRSHACFWYNPELGIVRARVPHEVSDAEALDLYNQVNGTTLGSLMWQAKRP